MSFFHQNYIYAIVPVSLFCMHVGSKMEALAIPSHKHGSFTDSRVIPIPSLPSSTGDTFLEICC